jgi:MoaA/NifB/PqqE/SkfB family radical SAM enzyme
MKSRQPALKSERSHIPGLNRGIRIFFSEFVRVSLARPVQALFYGGTVLHQWSAARRRARLSREGLHVPPIAIFSITDRCNLRCKGCYAQAIRREGPEELSEGELAGIVAQAEELGVSFFVIAGGEPLTRPVILDIAREHPRIVFLLITNGLLLDEGLIAQLAAQRNTVPVLSLEGAQAQTDERRGSGVHARLEQKMRELKQAGVFFAVSLTVTRANYDVVSDAGFIAGAVAQGCRLFFFMEYTPIREGTEEWVITEAQRGSMRERVAGFRRRFPAVFVAVPWDEEGTGGCLASGRGFVHISARGDLEPCPFAPYSDTSLKKISLRQGLRSPFLAAMRAGHESFAETEGGCSLWKRRSEVRALLASCTGGRALEGPEQVPEPSAVRSA